MKLGASLMLAFRFVKPPGKTMSRSKRNGTEKAAAGAGAHRSLMGAVFGIALSLVPLVVVLVVADGMIEGISARMIELSSYHLQTIDFSEQRTGFAPSLSVLEQDAAAVRSVPGVENTYVERQGLALAAGPLGRSGATVRAVEPKLFAENDALVSLFEVYEGSLSLPDARSALIGRKLADTVGLRAGDTMRLITMRTSPSGAVTPRVTSFTVSGVISSGYQELDALWVYVPLDTGFSLLSGPSSRTFIGVQTADPFADLNPVKAAVRSMLPSSYAVYTWPELNRGQYTSFRTTKLLLLFIMFLIVLVASVNVSSALVMLVMERRRELAILKSVGATPGGISFAFLFAGFLTGAAGVLAGMPLGILCAVNINGLLHWFEKGINFLGRFMYILSSSAGQTGTEYVPVHLLDPAYYLETIPVDLSYTELFAVDAGTLI